MGPDTTEDQMAEASGYQLSAIGPCDRSLCDKLRNEINQICQDLHKPPGSMIMIKAPDGKYCYCTCGGPAKK
jgi:hypothetical protein